MARVHTAKARFDIYLTGRKVVDKSTKSGFRLDRSQPANSKDTLLVPKGSTYYWWQFKGCGKAISLTKPRPSQLTRSEFLSTIYSIGERIDDMKADDYETPEALAADLAEIVSDLETLRDEQESRRDAMPEHLQDVGSGELLQNRYDAVQEMIDELEGIDLEDYEETHDEDDLRREVIEDEFGISDEDEADEGEQEEIANKEWRIADLIEEKKRDKLNDWLDEKISEIQNVSYNGD